MKTKATPTETYSVYQAGEMADAETIEAASALDAAWLWIVAHQKRLEQACQIAPIEFVVKSAKRRHEMTVYRRGGDFEVEEEL